jgi:hypothetical protein
VPGITVALDSQSGFGTLYENVDAVTPDFMLGPHSRESFGENPTEHIAFEF